MAILEIPNGWHWDSACNWHHLGCLGYDWKYLCIYTYMYQQWKEIENRDNKFEKEKSVVTEGYGGKKVGKKFHYNLKKRINGKIK